MSDTVVCDAYSEVCIDLQVIPNGPLTITTPGFQDSPVSGETATSTQVPRELPLTGATNGDIISVALLLVLIGVLLLLAGKKVWRSGK